MRPSPRDLVQRDGQQQYRRFKRLDRVPLRWHRHHVTWSKLGLGLVGAEHDTTAQTQQRSVSRTLVLAHNPLGR